MSTICIFSALFLPSMGGVERFTDSLAAELVKEGHSVVIVTNNTHGLADRETLESGAEVLRLPCKCALNGRYPIPVPNRCYRELMSHLKSITFDGVLVNTRFYIHSVIGVRFAESQGLRAIVLDHGSAYLTLGSRAIDWVIARYEDVITSYLKRRSVDFYGISKKSVEWLSHFGIEAKGVIGNSIDAAAYRAQSSGRDFRSELGIDKETFLISFTGRLVPEKGIGVLLSMMRKLVNENVCLVVAGIGPLGTLIRDASLPNVRLVGRLTPEDVATLLMDSDLFCLPSRSEGFSTSLLEASACEVPSLVTNVGGAAELIPSEAYGFIMENESSRDFAGIVCRCVHGEFDLSTMARRCRERVEALFSWGGAASRVSNAVNLAKRK